MPSNTSADLAADALSKVLQGRTLTQALETASLNPSMRGAVLDMAYGSLRYKGTLEAVLAQLLKKPLDDEFVHALLLAALYQLVYTQEAPYAVVDNAVIAAPRHLKGLANAVLRNFLRQREALPEAGQQSGAGRHNFPYWWVQKLRLAYPEHWQDILAASQLHPPMTLRVNSRKNSAEAYLAELQANAMGVRQTGASALTLEKPVRERSRLRAGGVTESRFPILDFNNPKHRTLIAVFSGMFVLMALLYAFAGFKTYEYTESDAFCGVLCHSSGQSIHRAENHSYSFSPHAKVGCSTCHVGSGVEYFVLYKVRGMRQLFNLLTGQVPRPIHTPVADLRPAQDVCESCHGPKYQFYERLEARQYFLSDTGNTPWKLDLLLKMGKIRPEIHFTRDVSQSTV